jgi:hypothetical protein
MNIKIKTTKYYEGNRKLNKVTGLALLLFGVLILGLLEFGLWVMAKNISTWNTYGSSDYSSVDYQIPTPPYVDDACQNYCPKNFEAYKYSVEYHKSSSNYICECYNKYETKIDTTTIN